MAYSSASNIVALRKHFMNHSKANAFHAHRGNVHTLAWNCDGFKLASGSVDQSIGIFSVSDTAVYQESIYQEHGGIVEKVHWHPSYANVLGSACGDKTLRIWDARCAQSLYRINTAGANNHVRWSPDGLTIAVGGPRHLAFIDSRTWRIQQFSVVCRINEFSWYGCNKIYLTAETGSIHVFTFPDIKQVDMIAAHTREAHCIEFESTGRYFATCSGDTGVKLWGINEYICLRTFLALKKPVGKISFTHDGLILASGSEDMVIDVFEVATGLSIAETFVHGKALSVTWHPRQYVLAYACDDTNPLLCFANRSTIHLAGYPSWQ